MSSWYSIVDILPTSSSKSAAGALIFNDFLCKSSSCHSPVHILPTSSSKSVPCPWVFWTCWSGNRALATVSCTFCRPHLPKSAPGQSVLKHFEDFEVEIKLYNPVHFSDQRPQPRKQRPATTEATLPEKNTRFRAGECFHPWTRAFPNCHSSQFLPDECLTWWCGWHDETWTWWQDSPWTFVHNSEVSELNFLWRIRTIVNHYQSKGSLVRNSSNMFEHFRVTDECPGAVLSFLSSCSCHMSTTSCAQFRIKIGKTQGIGALLKDEVGSISSFVDSLVPWFIDSAVQSFIASLTDWIIEPLIHWVVDSPIHWLTSSTCAFVHWFTQSSFHWFIGSLPHWFTESLLIHVIHLLLHSFIHSLVQWFTDSSTR